MECGAAQNQELAERAARVVAGALGEVALTRRAADIGREKRRSDGLRRPTVRAYVKVRPGQRALHREGEQTKNNQTQAPLRASQVVQGESGGHSGTLHLATLNFEF